MLSVSSPLESLSLADLETKCETGVAGVGNEIEFVDVGVDEGFDKLWLADIGVEGADRWGDLEGGVAITVVVGVGTFVEPFSVELISIFIMS